MDNGRALSCTFVMQEIDGLLYSSKLKKITPAREKERVSGPEPNRWVSIQISLEPILDRWHARM